MEPQASAVASPASRPYRTFWDWFAGQRCRPDDVGELARAVYQDPERAERSFTHTSLALFLSDTNQYDDDTVKTLVRLEEEFHTYTRRTQHREGFFLERFDTTGRGWLLVCICESMADAQKVAALHRTHGGDYRLVQYARGTLMCRSGRHEWWEQLSADHCCDPNWQSVTVFPTSELPDNYDTNLGIVTDPSGWRWVWVPV